MKESLIKKKYAPMENGTGGFEILKLAIQKSGRLYEDSVKLLKDCGIDIRNGHNRL